MFMYPKKKENYKVVIRQTELQSNCHSSQNQMKGRYFPHSPMQGRSRYTGPQVPSSPDSRTTGPKNPLCEFTDGGMQATLYSNTKWRLHLVGWLVQQQQHPCSRANRYDPWQLHQLLRLTLLISGHEWLCLTAREAHRLWNWKGKSLIDVIPTAQGELHNWI